MLLATLKVATDVANFTIVGVSDNTVLVKDRADPRSKGWLLDNMYSARALNELTSFRDVVLSKISTASDGMLSGVGDNVRYMIPGIISSRQHNKRDVTAHM